MSSSCYALWAINSPSACMQYSSYLVCRCWSSSCFCRRLVVSLSSASSLWVCRYCASFLLASSSASFSWRFRERILWVIWRTDHRLSDHLVSVHDIKTFATFAQFVNPLCGSISQQFTIQIRPIRKGKRVRGKFVSMIILKKKKVHKRKSNIHPNSGWIPESKN